MAAIGWLGCAALQASGCSGEVDPPEERTATSELANGIAIDATPITEMQLVSYCGGSVVFDSKVITTITGPQTNCVLETGAGGVIGFYSITAANTVTYDAALEGGVFTGQGSSTLRVTPHAISLDATGLTPTQLVFFGGTTVPQLDSTQIQHYALPALAYAAYIMETGTGGYIGAFFVRPDGTLAYDPALNGGVFSGLGTTTLHVVPHAITVDATPLAQTTILLFGASNTPGFDSKTVQHYQLAAAPSYVLETSSGALLGFLQVDASGRLDFPASSNSALHGRNSPTLTLFGTGGFELPPPTFNLPYHGGDLMATGAPVNIYLLFYGTWSEAQKHYFTNLSEHLGDSAWYGTLAMYRDHTRSPVKLGTHLGGVFLDRYSHGPNLDDGWATREVQAVLGDAFNGNDPRNPPLPRDPNGVYMVLLSPDVGFTSSAGPNGTYCGYHQPSLVGAQKYAVLPGSFYAPPYTGCNWTGPTGTFLDSMASVLAHELVESITDPDTGGGSGYTTTTTQGPYAAGSENADLCVWNDGPGDLSLTGGGIYNLKLGDQYYRVQQDLTNTAGVGYCSMGVPYSASNNAIGIQSAVYGDNCTPTDFVDLTTTVSQQCNGSATCSVLVDPALLGGYSGPSGCARSFTVQWACWNGPRIKTVPAEARNQVVNLTCP